jgi:hypothetical protein
MTKNQNQRAGEYLAGHVDVDAGMVMIGDPCYLEGWQGHSFGDDRPGEFSYAGACTATLSDDGCGELQHPATGSVGAAFACSSGYGDGTYPVYVTYNSEGRIVGLRVEFDSADDPDTEVMDECERCGTEVEMGTLEGGYCESCADYYADTDDEEDA